MKFIIVHLRGDGKAMHMNVDHIISFVAMDASNSTIFTTDGDSFNVRESALEIMDIIEGRR